MSKVYKISIETARQKAMQIALAQKAKHLNSEYKIDNSNSQIKILKPNSRICTTQPSPKSIQIKTKDASMDVKVFQPKVSSKVIHIRNNNQSIPIRLTPIKVKSEKRCMPQNQLSKKVKLNEPIMNEPAESVAIGHIEIEQSSHNDPLNINSCNLISDVSKRVDTISRIFSEQIPPTQPRDKNRKVNTEYILSEIASIKINLEEIKEDQKKILEILNSNKSVLDNPLYESDVIDDVFLFPITSIEQLETLDEKCVDKNFMRKFATLIKGFKPPEPSKEAHISSYGLAKMLSDDLILEFNWDGMHSKLGFSKYLKLNNAMYVAWRSQHISNFAMYKDNISLQFTNNRRRILKKRSNVRLYRNKQNQSVSQQVISNVGNTKYDFGGGNDTEEDND